MKIGLVFASGMAALLLTTVAFGQAPAPAPAAGPTSGPGTTASAGYVEQRLEGNQVVTFGGDPLQGDDNSAYGFTIRRPPGVLRAGLIRPRVNFVSELLKSVENL